MGGAGRGKGRRGEVLSSTPFLSAGGSGAEWCWGCGAGGGAVSQAQATPEVHLPARLAPVAPPFCCFTLSGTMASDFLGSFPDCVRTRLHHKCLWQTHCPTPGRRMGSPPTCPPHINSGTYTEIQLPTRQMLTESRRYSCSPTRFRFCSAPRRGWGRRCQRKPPPHPQFRKLPGPWKFGGLSESLHGLGFSDTLVPDCSLWGGPRTWWRRLGSSKFQEVHPSLVQATVNIWG